MHSKVLKSTQKVLKYFSMYSVLVHEYFCKEYKSTLTCTRIHSKYLVLSTQVLSKYSDPTLTQIMFYLQHAFLGCIYPILTQSD